MGSDELLRSREWCVLRNLVHTVYHEARHFGPSGDSEAKVTVSSGPFAGICKALSSGTLAEVSETKVNNGSERR